MPKLIRLEDSTYRELGLYGRWEDTMDTIVGQYMEARLNKHGHKEEVATR